MTPKQRSRARVVQALYQWLTSGGEIAQIEQQFLNQKEGKISKAFFSNLILPMLLLTRAVCLALGDGGVLLTRAICLALGDGEMV